MCHRIAGIVHGVGHKRSGDRQPAGRAGIALVGLLAGRTGHTGLSLWPDRSSLSTLAFWSFGVSKLWSDRPPDLRTQLSGDLTDHPGNDLHHKFMLSRDLLGDVTFNILAPSRRGIIRRCAAALLL
jgi:hypothetical protein